MTEQIRKTLKDSALLRWLVLLLISGLTFSTYWFQDFFGALKGLMFTEYGVTSEEFGRVIGFTTIANMFGMIIIGGIILDKWGVRIAGLLFGGLALLGASISAGATVGFFGEGKSTMLMWLIIGRIMFGSGLEVVCVVATRTVVKWFKGYELALAMAINMGFGRLGSALGLAVSLDIAAGSVSPAVSFAAKLIGLSILMFVVYIIFDVKIDKQNSEVKEAAGEDEQFKFNDLVKLITDRSFLFIALLCVSFYAAVFPFIQYAPDLLINKFGFTSELPEAGKFEIFGSSTIGTSIIYVILFIFGLGFSMLPSKMKTKSMKIASFLIVFLIFSIFIYSLSDVLAIWFENGPKTASLIPMGTILFTPIFGSYVDKKGKAASLMIVGALLLIFAHLSLSIFNSVLLGYLGLLSLGIAFSLVPAAMWPSVAKIVAENRLGTAYASMFTIQNWGLGLFFWGIGALLDFTNKDNLEAIKAKEAVFDYTIPILVLVLLGVISIYLSFMLKKADKKQGYGLELPSGK